MHRSLIVIALFSVAVSACSSISKNQCLGQDWQTMGYKDGLLGLDKDHLYQHARACEQFGTTPDAARYAAGYNRGIAEYCLPSSAMRLGKSVNEYDGVCPKSQATNFIASYKLGLNEALQDEVVRESKLKRNLNKLRNIRTFRYWYRKLTGRYEKAKQSVKDDINTSAQRQADIQKMIDQWESSEGKSTNNE